jgi:hypothetical protein
MSLGRISTSQTWRERVISSPLKLQKLLQSGKNKDNWLSIVFFRNSRQKCEGQENVSGEIYYSIFLALLKSSGGLGQKIWAFSLLLFRAMILTT